MSAKQLHLNMAEKKNRKKAGPHLARKMIAYLFMNRRWVNRTEFRQNCQLTDRECRLGRSASNGRIMAGQQGYKLRALGTVEEIRADLATWVSRRNAMDEEYRQAVKRSHALLINERGELK